LGRPAFVIPREEGATIMHELGHNLALEHGVNIVNGVHVPTQAYQFSPIYFSVMNYNYALGLLFAAAPGSASPAYQRIDFADDTVCADLDEAALDELAGAQCGATSTRVIRFVPDTGTPVFASATTGTSVDWNNDGTISTSTIAADLTGIVPNEKFYTFNEWAYVDGKFTNLKFDSLCSPWTVADALAPEAARVVEPSRRDLLRTEGLH
jgi:hypothetical protein